MTKISNGIDLLEFLSKNNIMQSKSEARRAIANNGLKINNEIVKTEKKFIELNDFKEKEYVKFLLVKKNTT